MNYSIFQKDNEMYFLYRLSVPIIAEAVGGGIFEQFRDLDDVDVIDYGEFDSDVEDNETETFIQLAENATCLSYPTPVPADAILIASCALIILVLEKMFQSLHSIPSCHF